MYPTAFPVVRDDQYTLARRLTWISTPLAWLICPKSGAKVDLYFFSLYVLNGKQRRKKRLAQTYLKLAHNFRNIGSF